MVELTEVRAVRQIPGEPRRRWFSSAQFDLIVWSDDSGSPVGFQLCYDKMHAERALTWKQDSGFMHMAIDDGEKDVGFGFKGTPLLVADGHFDAERIGRLFALASENMPPAIAEFVAAKLRQHPGLPE